MLQLLGGLHALVPELDDVHACGEHRVQESGEVTLELAGVRAQIEPGIGQLLARRGHGRTPPWS